jgi:hypothetical protein
LVVSVSVAAAGDVAKVPLAPDDGAVKVTETPLAGDPFDVTVAEKVPNEPPTVALVVYPLFAVIAMVGFVLPPLPEPELLPPHANRKLMAAHDMKLTMPMYILRFIEMPPSA